jgi:hypothetical protein
MFYRTTAVPSISWNLSGARRAAIWPNLIRFARASRHRENSLMVKGKRHTTYLSMANCSRLTKSSQRGKNPMYLRILVDSSSNIGRGNTFLGTVDNIAKIY